MKNIGISCGGPLDSKTGVIMSPPNLPGWDDVPVVKFFADRYGVPVHLQNDASVFRDRERFGLWQNENAEVLIETPDCRSRRAARQQDLLDMIAEGTKPSYMYYYHTGHLPASTFCTVRERLVEGILDLQEAAK